MYVCKDSAAIAHAVKPELVRTIYVLYVCIYVKIRRHQHTRLKIRRHQHTRLNPR